jgi:phosphoglycerate dehydrogenase-like enzyme
VVTVGADQEHRKKHLMTERRGDGVTDPVVGLYCANPETILPRIRERVSEDRIRTCTRWDGLGEILEEIDIVVAFKFGTNPFPKDQILASDRLQWVQLASAGVDHMVPHDRSDLLVTNASGIHGLTMAQFVVGTLVSRLWDFPRLFRQQAERTWKKFDVGTLAGKTMAVIGAGHIGVSIGRAVKPFDMRVVGVRRSGRPVPEFDQIYGPDELKRAMEEAYVTVVTLPLTRGTRGLIGAGELAAMPDDGILVNVSRGGVVDEPALLRHLKERPESAAILDVFATEPLPEDSEFWGLENVLVTPHISSEAEGWEIDVADIFLWNLERWVADEPLRNIVDPVAGY